ncbi:hypothetical protein AB3X52_13410 [Nocardioides sp. DS6]|uniref:Uncharacterized protein n=1 Tax=Nocardioides eburneus TaxID=3231482 RepID=A0ABV3T0H4_9ACTN
MTQPTIDHSETLPLAQAARAQRLQNTSGRRRARRRNPAASGSPASAAIHGAACGFAARESPEYGHLLLAKMIQQTLEPHKHLPQVARALDLGVTPILDNEEGRRVRAELGAQLLYFSDRPRKYFGVRFVIDGIPFQYGLLSGAKSNAVNGDNNWVDSIIDMVETYTPAELCIGPASRLARLKRFFSKLEHHLAQTRTLVRTAEIPSGLDLAFPVGPPGGGMRGWPAANDVATVKQSSAAGSHSGRLAFGQFLPFPEHLAVLLMNPIPMWATSTRSYRRSREEPIVVSALRGARWMTFGWGLLIGHNGVSTWPPVGTFSWPRACAGLDRAQQSSGVKPQGDLGFHLFRA